MMNQHAAESALLKELFSTMSSGDIARLEAILQENAFVDSREDRVGGWTPLLIAAHERVCLCVCVVVYYVCICVCFCVVWALYMVLKGHIFFKCM